MLTQLWRLWLRVVFTEFSKRLASYGLVGGCGTIAVGAVQLLLLTVRQW